MSQNRNFFKKGPFGYLTRELDDDFLLLLDNPEKIKKCIAQTFSDIISVAYCMNQLGISRDADQQLISILNILIDILVRDSRERYPQKYKNEKELVSSSVYDAANIMVTSCGAYGNQDFTEMDILFWNLKNVNIDDADKSKLTEAFAELRKIADENNPRIQNQAPPSPTMNKFFSPVSTKVDGKKTDKQSNKFDLRNL